MPTFVKFKRGKFKPEDTFKGINAWIDGLLTEIEDLLSKALALSFTGNVTAGDTANGMGIRIPQFPIAIAVSTSTIPVRSGTTAGQGTADFRMFNADTATFLSDPALTAIKVYNWSSSTPAVASGKWMLLLKLWDVWWVVSTECP